MTETVAALEMTRYGRCYAPEELNSANSNKEQNQRRNITDIEEIEFWRKVSVKVYSIEEKLRKAPAHISIMDLLLSFESHRDTLVKGLSGVSVPRNTTSEALAPTIW